MTFTLIGTMSSGRNRMSSCVGYCLTMPKRHAENEFEKYRVIQDRLFQSDFDKQLDLLGRNDEEGNNV